MRPKLRDHLEQELARAASLARADSHAAWTALERAHILSQAFAGAHLRVHARMLLQAWRERRWSEVVGQLPRLALAAPASWLGRAPRGNTGGSDVGMFTAMAIPDDLRAILDDTV